MNVMDNNYAGIINLLVTQAVTKVSRIRSKDSSNVKGNCERYSWKYLMCNEFY